MTLANEILGRIDTAQLAQAVGTDQASAEAAAQDAVQLLLGGMHRNVQSPQGESALAGALEDHARQSALFERGDVNLDEVDVNDGSRIVDHVLGTDDVTSLDAAHFGGLQAASGQDAQLLNKVIKYLAPLVLAYIAKQIAANQGSILDKAKNDPQGGGGILGQILGQVLGGGQSAPQTAPAQPAEPAQPAQPTMPVDSNSGDGELRIDVDDEPSTRDAQQRQAPQQRQTPQQGGHGGGILGQILGGMFGR